MGSPKEVIAIRDESDDEEILFLGTDAEFPSADIMPKAWVVPFQQKISPQIEMRTLNETLSTSHISDLGRAPFRSSSDQKLRNGQVNVPQDLIRSPWTFREATQPATSDNLMPPPTHEDSNANEIPRNDPALLHKDKNHGFYPIPPGIVGRWQGSSDTSNSETNSIHICRNKPTDHLPLHPSIPRNIEAFGKNHMDVCGHRDKKALEASRNTELERRLIRAARRPTQDECKVISVVSLLEDEEDDFSPPTVTGTQSCRRSTPKHTPLSSEFVVIDLDEEEENLFGDYGRELELDSGTRLPEGSSRRSTEAPQRNTPITYPQELIERWKFKPNVDLRSGKTVELETGDFLLITSLIRHVHTKEITVRGHRLQRTRYMNGLCAAKCNELCWLVEIDQDDPRELTEQSVTEVLATEIKSLRQLKITNTEYPLVSFRDEKIPREEGGNLLQMQMEGPLVLRWRYICTYATARHRLNNSYLERSMEHLRMEHLIELERLKYSIDDDERRVTWRGETMKGGEYMISASGPRKNHNQRDSISSMSRANSGSERSRKRKRFSDDMYSSVPSSPSLDASNRLGRRRVEGVACNRASITSIDLTRDYEQVQGLSATKPIVLSSTLPLTPTRSPLSTKIVSLMNPSNSVDMPEQARYNGQKYTFGDCFCGAGGATRGAQNAGFKVVWGNDCDVFAGASWMKNFPRAKLHRMFADEFISLGKIPGAELTVKKEMRVDILHLSPPCQYFSPAHTCPGKNDEMNSATLFACGELVDLARPRLITLEQTFGLTHVRFRGFLNSLLRLFIERGFSVRWKVAALKNWGLPQRRLRLIIIGACPGEKLPDFPPFTHAENGEGGLRPLRSVNSVIRSIQYGAKDHDLDNVKPRNMAPWDGNSIAPRCITTSGGQNYHPSGKRDFTNRELAALQGFPEFHEFCGSYVVKQIGNAFPATVVEVLYKHLLKALKKADGIRAEVISIDLC